MSALDFAGARARHELVDVASRYLPDLKKQGGEFKAMCPFHNDSDPSFTIFRGRDGIQRYKCFPCGAHGDVIDFVAEMESVEPAEAVRRLDGGQMPQPNTREVRTLPPDASDCWEAIVPVPANAPAFDPRQVYNPKRDKVVSYRPAHMATWRQADGALVGYIVRLEMDDKTKIIVTCTYCAGPGGPRWCAKRPELSAFPFVGAEALQARPGAPVLIVEGEKKRDAVAGVLPGFVVLSLYGGSNNVEAMDIAPLRGRGITLWPDADAPGNRVMHQLAARLRPPDA